MNSNNLSQNVLSQDLENSLGIIKQNLDHNKMNPVNTALTPEQQKSHQLRTKLDQYKAEISTEIGLDKALQAVGGDNGLLTPNDFGHLGGQMTSRLVARGKDIYRRMQNEQ